MRKFWTILITMAAVLVGSIFTAETALAFSVTGIGQAQYLSEYGSSEIKSLDVDGEQVVFSRDGKGNLHLYDQYKNTKYMSFKETFKGMTEYSITRINLGPQKDCVGNKC